MAARYMARFGRQSLARARRGRCKKCTDEGLRLARRLDDGTIPTRRAAFILRRAAFNRRHCKDVQLDVAIGVLGLRQDRI